MEATRPSRRLHVINQTTIAFSPRASFCEFKHLLTLTAAFLPTYVTSPGDAATVARCGEPDLTVCQHST
jgi:hypothetical protein